MTNSAHRIRFILSRLVGLILAIGACIPQSGYHSGTGLTERPWFVGESIADSCSGVLERSRDTLSRELGLSFEVVRGVADSLPLQRAYDGINAMMEFPEYIEIPFALLADSLVQRAVQPSGIGPFVPPLDATIEIEVDGGRVSAARLTHPSFVQPVHRRILEAVGRADSLGLFRSIGVSGALTLRVHGRLARPGETSHARVRRQFSFITPRVETPATHGRRMARPIYPPNQWRAGEDGDVVAAFVIAVDGKPEAGVISIRHSTRDEFAASVIQAIKESQFEPGITSGCPVPVLVIIPYGFRVVSERPPCLLGPGSCP